MTFERVPSIAPRLSRLQPRAPREMTHTHTIQSFIYPMKHTHGLEGRPPVYYEHEVCVCVCVCEIRVKLPTYSKPVAWLGQTSALCPLDEL